MARIAGVDIPRDKRVLVSLTYIYGIGRATSREILKAAEVDENKRVKDLSDDELAAIRREVQTRKVEGDLRREVNLNIKRFPESQAIPTTTKKRTHLQAQLNKAGELVS